MKEKSAYAYVDGYNLYHGIISKRNTTPPGFTPFNSDRPWGDLLWLNLESFINSFKLPNLILKKIKFFEAPSYKPHSLLRQQIYRNALLSLKTMDEDCFFGGSFKPNLIKCPTCESEFYNHIEKQTDVEISTEILYDYFQGNCDAIILISGDSDQIPVIKKIKKIQPDYDVYVIFPPSRKSDELASLLGRNNWKKATYYCLIQNQFNDPLLYDGKTINKPSEYK